MIEGAQLMFKNLAGKEDQFNRAGNRNFCVLLPDDVGETMLQDGWNVKFLEAREEGDTPKPYIQVSVGFDNYPPKIVMITSVGRTNLTEATVETLDWADILTVDLIARGYEWVVQGKSGVKAYLKSMYVTIDEDPLERKYARELPEED